MYRDETAGRIELSCRSSEVGLCQCNIMLGSDSFTIRGNQRQKCSNFGTHRPICILILGSNQVNDFKLGSQLCPDSSMQWHHSRRTGVKLGYGSTPEFLGPVLDICATTAEASELS